jgi:hypothetical protein
MYNLTKMYRLVKFQVKNIVDVKIQPLIVTIKAN